MIEEECFGSFPIVSDSLTNMMLFAFDDLLQLKNQFFLFKILCLHY